MCQMFCFQITLFTVNNATSQKMLGNAQLLQTPFRVFGDRGGENVLWDTRIHGGQHGTQCFIALQFKRDIVHGL